MDSVERLLWVGFATSVGTLLLLDLAVVNRRSRVLSLRQAATWSACIVTAALGAGLAILALRGPRTALEYYTGYLIELSLSVDNLFVFILIFDWFGVPPELRQRVLKWGVLGAMVMRGIMIAAGTLLLERFHFVIYFFGALLVLTGWKLLRERELHVELERNLAVRLARRLIPLSDRYDGQHFFTRGERGLLATPLLLVLLVVEWSDLVFAIDSIPAIFAVTRDPFIVYSSNVFAVLGLRALFFVVAAALQELHYLRPGVALILVFIGLKMLCESWVAVPVGLSLGVVLATLLGASLLSLRRRPT